MPLILSTPTYTPRARPPTTSRLMKKARKVLPPRPFLRFLAGAEPERCRWRGRSSSSHARSSSFICTLPPGRSATNDSGTYGVEPTLQDLHRSRLIDDRALASASDAALRQPTCCRHGGHPLVREHDGHRS